MKATGANIWYFLVALMALFICAGAERMSSRNKRQAGDFARGALNYLLQSARASAQHPGRAPARNNHPAFRRPNLLTVEIRLSTRKVELYSYLKPTCLSDQIFKRKEDMNLQE
ncbi:unnamed protein product [Cylicocyclus nassatus]|uniref:Uncharacterized protein n=1 Tax=Cylicocyclus nassatus TaxID=53992 RepID=A0AA36MB40_CYLNA|nr:unnamed protein product [Cylicocyclus nassatus]